MFRKVSSTLIIYLTLYSLIMPRPLSAQTPPDSPDAPTPTQPSAQNKIYLPLITLGDPLTASVTEWPETSQPDPALAPLEEELWPDDEEAAIDEARSVQAAVALSAISVIDYTEDYKALGYPDARKLVRNSRGDLYVAYRKKFNGRYRIFVAESKDEGRSWQILNAGEPVETVGRYTQRVPAIEIDNRDQLHLVWYGNDAANGNANNTSNEREIKYIRSSPTTGTTDASITWNKWSNLYNGTGYRGESLWQEHPTLYVNGTNVYIVWESNETTKNTIKFVRSTDYGEVWSEVINVRPSTMISFSRPTLVVSYAGEQRYLYLVAYGTKRGVARIFWTRSADNGESWDQWRAVAAGKLDQRHVSMARDDAGRLHIVWRQVKNNSTILRYRVYDPERRQGRGGWHSGPKTIASVRNHCLFFPSIAVSGKNSSRDPSDPSANDTVWVTWTQSDDCTSIPSDDPVAGRIYLATQGPNGKWSKPQAVSPTGRHLYATLRRANSPSSTAGNVDLIWLDATASPLDPTTGKPTCAAESCLLKHIALGEW